MLQKIQQVKTERFPASFSTFLPQMKSSVIKEDTIGHDGKRAKQGGFGIYMGEIT